MTILTDFDRKRIKERRLYVVGMYAAGILFGAALAWFDQTKFGVILRLVALTVPLGALVFCYWRYESITNCSTYCPDEPMPKD